MNSVLREKFSKTIGNSDLRTIIREIVVQQYREKESQRTESEKKLLQEYSRAFSELGKLNELLTSIEARFGTFESKVSNLTKNISTIETECIDREKSHKDELLKLINTKLESFKKNLDQEKENIHKRHSEERRLLDEKLQEIKKKRV